MLTKSGTPKKCWIIQHANMKPDSGEQTMTRGVVTRKRGFSSRSPPHSWFWKYTWPEMDANAPKIYTKTVDTYFMHKIEDTTLLL